MAEEVLRLRAEVRGNVQGVGFRYRTRECARRLGLSVSAENRSDGSVLVLAAGSRAACEELLGFLTGPAAPGRVDDVTITWG